MSADLAALEFANDAFYQAFAAGSLEAMEAVWAEQPIVFCVHPGWPPITNRAEVMASWREILSNSGPRGRPQGDDLRRCRAGLLL